MKYGIIYKITCKTTKKIYIGQTVQRLQKRWRLHQIDAKKEKSRSVIHSAILKYGKDSFDLEWICSCLDKSELDFREDYFINQLNTLTPNGYNTKRGGANGKWSKQRRDELSQQLQEKCQNPERKQHFLNQMIEGQNRLTPEEKDQQLQLQSEASKEYWNTSGIKEAKSDVETARWKELTEEDKNKRLKGFREYWTPERLAEHSKHIKELQSWKKSGCLERAQEVTSKSVKVIEISTQRGTIYKSRAKCCKQLKMTAQTLIDILSGKRSNEHKGYRFFSL